MKKKLTHNLFLKILSIAFAFMLWLLVAIITDPYKTVIISGVPITIKNEGEITNQGIGQIYSVMSPQNLTVSVKVYGQKSKVDKLSARDIKATVDFGEVSSVGAAYIVVEDLGDVTVLSKSPEMMKISVEALAQKDFDIEVVTKGKPAEGYLINSTRVSPNVTRVIAPESIMNRIEKVVVEANVNGLSNDIDKNARVVLYDAAGKVINYEKDDNVTLSTSTVKLYAETFWTKNVIVDLRYGGNLPDNLKLMEIKVSPVSVTLKGRKEDLAKINDINVPGNSGAVDLSSVTRSESRVVDVLPYLPENVYFLNEGDNLITVDIVVEPIMSKTFEIPVSQIQMLNTGVNMQASWNQEDSISVTLSGTENDMKGLTADSLAPYVNLMGLKEGKYSCEVYFKIPTVINIKDNVFVEVQVEKEQVQEVIEPETNESGITEPVT